MLFRPLFLATLLFQLTAVSVRVVAVAPNNNSALLLEEQQGDAAASSATTATATRAVMTGATDDTTTTNSGVAVAVDVGERAVKRKLLKNKGSSRSKSSKSKQTKSSKSSKTKGSKKSSRSRAPTLAPTPVVVIPTSAPSPVPTMPPTSAPTMAPTSSVSGATAVLVAAPPGLSAEEMEEEVTAQVMATLGLGGTLLTTRTTPTSNNIFINKRRDLLPAAVRPLPTQTQQHPQQPRQLFMFFEDGATTTTVATVASVIDCQEIFIDPSPQPPNVEVCYRAIITITITSSEGEYVDYEVVIGNYINTILDKVRTGVFTEALQYLVVEVGSTDLTGVPTSSPSGTPTMAPVVPTTPPTNAPTEEPTKPPTMSPKMPPTPAPYTPPTETVRWTSYVQFTAQQLVLVRALAYTQTTWNTLGTNSLEESAFYALTPAEAAASEQLGMDEEEWDCYQNHYGDYSWDELELYSLDTYWRALGWTRTSWEGDSNPPSTGDKFWMELTRQQQEAAIELCYIQQVWDEIPIPQWF